jgi:integrase
MPKYPGVHPKKLKSGAVQFYGSKWWEDKAYSTSLYPTAREAWEALQKLIKELQLGKHFDKKSITVQQFVELYLEYYIKPKTLDPFTKKLIESRLHTAIVPCIGKRRLQSLRPVDMQQLQNHLLGIYSAKTVNRYIGEWKRVIKRALVWDYLVKDTTLGLDRIKEQEKKPEILEPEQILGVIYNQRFDLRDRCRIGLGGFAGLRISEAFALQRSKIDFDEHTIFINLQFFQGTLKPPKSNSERYVPILPDLEPLLKETYLKSTYWLFPGEKEGRPRTSTAWVKNHFQPILRESGLPIVKYHSLRHAFNKMLYDHGVPQREVMQIMGHKPQGMTWHYDRESVQRCVKITRRIKFLKSFSQNIPQNGSNKSS